MTKTITITDLSLVGIGDKAYFKNCDYGFTVLAVDEDDAIYTLKVDIPTCEEGLWSCSSLFDHATKEVKEPEWPEPHDSKLHIYLGVNGKRYIYNPTDDGDFLSWIIVGHNSYHSREELEAFHHDALPLTELKLVPVKDDDDE